MYLHESKQRNFLQDNPFVGNKVCLGGPLGSQFVESGNITSIHNVKQFNQPTLLLVLQ